MNNRDFWNARYRTLPWLGSGPGSRGVGQHYKAYLLQNVLRKNRIESIVDVGCGDMCWLRTDRLSAGTFGGIRFVGLDISEVAVQMNRQRFPALEFEIHDLSRKPLPEQVDLLLCFDVLIHQTSREQFTRCLNHLLDGIVRHALVSYKNPSRPGTAIKPCFDGFDPAVEATFRQSLAELRKKEQHPTGTTAFFGNLPELISELSNRHRVTHVGDYNFQSVYEVSCSERLVF